MKEWVASPNTYYQNLGHFYFGQSLSIIQKRFWNLLRTTWLNFSDTDSTNPTSDSLISSQSNKFKPRRGPKIKKMSKNLIFGYSDHSKMHFWMIQHESNDGQMVYTIYFYQNMQYQVSPIHQTQENGEKAHFWLIWIIQNAFFWFLNDPTWL